MRKKRKKDFYIFGKNPIKEYIERRPEDLIRIFISDRLSAHEFQSILEKTREYRIPVSRVSEKNIKNYVGDIAHQGIVALVKEFSYYDIDTFLDSLDGEKSQIILVLDKIQDTHNFGAIIRTAVAAGASAIIVAKDSQAPVNGTVFKTSAGTILSIPIIRVANLGQALVKLQKKRFWIFALDIGDENRDTNFYWDQDYTGDSFAFILGSEGKGVSQKLKEKSDYVISIPMERGVESLNVSVAAALILYEWKRQNFKKER